MTEALEAVRGTVADYDPDPGEPRIHPSARTSEYVGETRAYVGGVSSAGGRDTFHADKTCRHLEGSSVLYVHPIGKCRGSYAMEPCGHCTTEGGSE